MNNKKFIINSTCLLAPLAGIGRYTHEILKRMPLDQDVKYYYYYYGKVSKQLLLNDEAHKTKHAFLKLLREIITKHDLTKHVARNMIEMYSQAFSRSYNLYWEPAIIPRTTIRSAATITSVHDMSLHLFPQWHSDESVCFFKNHFFKNIKRTDMIITDTEAIKYEVSEILKFPLDRITSISLGVDSGVFRRYDKKMLEECAHKYKITDKFILIVGSIEPRKNLIRLIQAYKLLPQSIKDEYKIIIVGGKGWKNKEIHSLINSEYENIKYLGFVPDKDLALIYNLASLYVYPSLYEGFGLPPLEAMSCGTPTIVSDIPSVREVCADSAFYINPNDTSSIRDAIEYLLLNESVRQEMSEKGILHTRNYTWDETAKKYYTLFKSYL